MGRLSVVAFAFSLLANGCAEHPDESAEDAPDAAKSYGPVLLRPGYYVAETLPIVLVSDGDSVAVRFAAQGGYAMFVGARVSGLDLGPARIASELVNPEDGKALVADARLVELVATTDGSGEVEPDFQSSANFSHLVPCPNYGDRPVHGVEWLLNLKMSDPKIDERSASVSVKVIPTCAQGSRYLKCLCECEPGYVYAKCGAQH